ncbi:MAG: 7-carboxy-7-deazaguanine synthase QueE [Candidatus Aenigmatarchaeota archaeon]
MDSLKIIDNNYYIPNNILELDEKQLYEIFTHEPVRVIQGEGRYQGLNSILIRFGLCNLRCNFCDAAQNWDAKLKLTLSELLTKWPAIKSSNLIITGGEPLLNNYRQYFISQLLYQIDNTKIVEIETNGTNDIKFSVIVERCQINISPKELRYQLPVVTEVEYKLFEQVKNKEIPNYIVKFVFDNSDEVKKFIETVINKYQIPENNVYIMPKGATKEKLKENLFYTLDYAIKNNFNFSTRLHIFLDIAKYLQEPDTM